MNIEGPDVVCVESRKVRRDVRKFLKEGELTKLNRMKLRQPKRPKVSDVPLPTATSKEGKRVCEKKPKVPVVYVYNSEGTESYTYVECAKDDKGKLQPVYSIPIGEKEESESNR